jgi:hypothetical protein
MVAPRRVLIVGLDPDLVPMDAAARAAFPGLDPATVRGALERERAALEALGHRAELCLTDDGDTAEAVLARALDAAPCDCVVVGAGVRVPPHRLPLFERVINLSTATRRGPRSASTRGRTTPPRRRGAGCSAMRMLLPTTVVGNRPQRTGWCVATPWSGAA